MLIGVSGGIGSGKSAVCRICALQGIPVYDCDTRAKELMHTCSPLRESLIAEVGETVYDGPGGSLNKAMLSEHIFSSADKRERVEAIVHAAVREDIEKWVRAHAQVSGPLLIESAILHTSGLDKMVQHIWLVQAPQSVRIQRVMARSSLTPEQIQARINAQAGEYEALQGPHTSIIINDGNTPLTLQIEELLLNSK